MLPDRFSGLKKINVSKRERERKEEKRAVHEPHVESRTRFEGAKSKRPWRERRNVAKKHSSKKQPASLDGATTKNEKVSLTLSLSRSGLFNLFERTEKWERNRKWRSSHRKWT